MASAESAKRFVLTSAASLGASLATELTAEQHDANVTDHAGMDVLFYGALPRRRLVDAATR